MVQTRFESDLPFLTTGVDRVTLSTSRFEITSSELLTIKQTVGVGGELSSGQLCVCRDGVPLDADRAFFNGPWWSVTVGHRRLAPLQIDINAARMVWGDNYFPAGGQQVSEALGRLQAELWRAGIVIEPSDLSISTLEVSSMIAVDHPLEDCLRAIDEWGVRGRMKKVHRNKGWLCFSNGSRSISFYDKYLQANGEEKTDAPYMLRIETKAKRAQLLKRMGYGYEQLAQGELSPLYDWHRKMMLDCIGGEA